MTEIQPQRTLPDSQRAHRAASFKTWLKDPFHVASVLPSSKDLAKLVASGLGPGVRVVELGPGTGAVTEAILESGVRPEDLYLIEQNGTFVEILRHRFPGVTVRHGDAGALTRQFGDLRGHIDYVISGVPILWFKREKKVEILREAFSLLGPKGRFHQLTYFGRMPINGQILASLDLKPKLLGISTRNLPPAFVYRIERRSAARSR
jgi:phosphatidylethanolamine/phosphatidyl-N-methylethanolamine N-methyltransferase